MLVKRIVPPSISPAKLLRYFARKVQKARRELLLSPGKILAEGSKCLRLTAGHWSKHVFIAGGSGNGKSKLLELICRQLLDQGQGFTFIDPDGDTGKAVAAYAAAAGIDPLDIIHFKPDADLCIALDLLDGAPECDGPNKGLKLGAWIDSTADRIIRALLRNSSQADQDMMRRLKHRLRTLIWVCAVRVNGKHLGLSDMRALVDPRREEFGQIIDRVGPELLRLKPEVFYELQELRGTKSDTLRNQWMESTVNLLDDVLGILLQLIFGQHAPSLDLKEVIRQRKLLIVDLSETDDLSRGQANAIGGMLISFLINTARKTPEKDRTPHYLILDEAENFIGEDLRMAFAQMRKFKMPVCIAFQDLSCLKKGDLDLKERVIDNCAVWFVFQQTDPENVEYLGKALKYGSLDLTPLIQDTVLPDGYEWVDTQSLSIGLGTSDSTSETESASLTRSQTRQKHTAESIQVGVNVSLSDTTTESENQTNSRGGADGESGGTTFTDTKQEGVSHTDSQNEQQSAGETSSRQAGEGVVFGPNGPIYNRNAGLGRVESESEARGSGRADSLSMMSGTSEGSTSGWNWQKNWSRAKGWGMAWARAISHGLSLGKGLTKGESRGLSMGMALGLAKGKTHGKSASVGMTMQKTPLAKHKFTKTPTGGLVVSVQDQFTGVMNHLASLAERMVLVKVKGMASPFLMEVHNVKEPRAALGKKAKNEDVQAFLARVYQAPFYFKPTDDAHRGRIARFLAETAVAPTEEHGPKNSEEIPYGH
jgi:TraM recognition site of TraD and TraG